jgi:hypothetical protein
MKPSDFPNYFAYPRNYQITLTNEEDNALSKAISTLEHYIADLIKTKTNWQDASSEEKDKIIQDFHQDSFHFLLRDTIRDYLGIERGKYYH